MLMKMMLKVRHHYKSSYESAKTEQDFRESVREYPLINAHPHVPHPFGSCYKKVPINNRLLAKLLEL